MLSSSFSKLLIAGAGLLAGVQAACAPDTLDDTSFSGQLAVFTAQPYANETAPWAGMTLRYLFLGDDTTSTPGIDPSGQSDPLVYQLQSGDWHLFYQESNGGFIDSGHLGGLTHNAYVPVGKAKGYHTASIIFPAAGTRRGRNYRRSLGGWFLAATGVGVRRRRQYELRHDPTLKRETSMAFLVCRLDDDGGSSANYAVAYLYTRRAAVTQLPEGCQYASLITTIDVSDYPGPC